MTPTRIDVVSIFPDYLAPVRLSLLGRAQADGLLSVQVHDLRDFTSDRHRTVDDTPYGGGAGMVMRPDPWGAALDALLDDAGAPNGQRPTLIVPTPSGALFTQAAALELASRPWLIVACARYEGIDQRVVDHYRGRLGVRELSIGDYVLNGGEAAALVMIEAVARLLPGFVGNPESLAEESHGLRGAADLLEYPVYTRPPLWRGLAVPEVLLSGHHGDIASWRRAAAVRRTVERRPDLAHPSSALMLPGAGTDADPVSVRLAQPADAPELLVLQRCCSVGEAQPGAAPYPPALTETLDDVRAALDSWQTFVVRSAGRLVASVRGRSVEETGGLLRWDVERLMVAPDLTGRGIGSALLGYAEAAAPAAVAAYQVVTGPRSERSRRMFRRAGYRLVPTREGEDVVTMRKAARTAAPPVL